MDTMTSPRAHQRRSHRLALRLAFAAALVAGPALPRGASAQQVFATPDATADALVSAASADNPGFVETLFGPGAKDILSSGDAEEDQRRLSAFVDTARDGVKLESPSPDKRVLALGKTGWPFPVPLVKQAAGWDFDVQAGREELVNRTIGFNEFSAIVACNAYVNAQREYFREDRDGDGVQQLPSASSADRDAMTASTGRPPPSPTAARSTAASAATSPAVPPRPRRRLNHIGAITSGCSGRRARRCLAGLRLRRQRPDALRLRASGLSRRTGQDGGDDVRLQPAGLNLPEEPRLGHAA
jgi:hypothetical protein